MCVPTPRGVANLGALMKQILTITLGLAALSVAWQAAAQVTLYEREGLHGQVFTADRSVSDLERYGFNDRASSAIVQRGQWQVCEHANFEGSCTILRPGQYPSLAAMGMNDRISSLRKVQGSSKPCLCTGTARRCPVSLLSAAW